MTIDVAAPAQPHTDANVPPTAAPAVPPAGEQPPAAPAAPAPAAPVEGANPPPVTPETPPAPAEPAALDYTAMVDALKMPDGVDPANALSPEEKAEFAKLAASGEFSEKQLQLIHDQMVGGKADNSAQLKAQVEQWKQEVAKDPELAGVNGDKLPATQANVERGFAAFGSPQLKEFFDYSGLGNHPMFVKLFAAIGDKLAGDTTRPTPNGDGAQVPKRPEDVLYS